MNAVNLSSHEHPVHVCVNERGSICLESFLFVFLGQKKKKKKIGKKRLLCNSNVNIATG